MELFNLAFRLKDIHNFKIWLVIYFTTILLTFTITLSIGGCIIYRVKWKKNKADTADYDSVPFNPSYNIKEHDYNTTYVEKERFSTASLDTEAEFSCFDEIKNNNRPSAEIGQMRLLSVKN